MKWLVRSWVVKVLVAPVLAFGGNGGDGCGFGRVGSVGPGPGSVGLGTGSVGPGAEDGSVASVELIARGNSIAMMTTVRTNKHFGDMASRHPNKLLLP
jgi:hypothetical protein